MKCRLQPCSTFILYAVALKHHYNPLFKDDSDFKMIISNENISKKRAI
jgi:hypothetical protein